MSERRSCVVADDHPALLHSLRDVLARSGFPAPVAATTAPAAVAAIAAERPELALLDYRMAAFPGDELIRRAHEASPRTAIVVYTAEADSTLATLALERGARGIVLKQSPLPDLVRAIDAVLAGGLYVDPLVTGLVATPGSRPRLTPREREVLDHLTRGLSHDQIAERLAVSPTTVRAHVRNAVSRLEARNRTHAVATALRSGLLR